MYLPNMDVMSHRSPSLLRQNSRASQRSNPSSKGFRLLDESHDPFETGSVYSVYKQKIDKMFMPEGRNTVQARIEKMFSEVAYEEGLKNDPLSHTFSIDYLGSIPLQEKVTSLAGLQIPLKELYFAYKRSLKHKGVIFTGKLEISHIGLKVRYQGDKGDLEQLNPFPTIAVWSAVKFIYHSNPISYAFLPLITDPDNIDKQTLFQNLEEADSKYILNQSHAPLFTVVMRKIGLHKQLECHAFICQTSEDAIVIAATLYKSLMNHMKNKDKKPKNKNGVSCMSVSSSTFADSITNPTPVRPPRKKRSTASSTFSESDTNLTKPVKKSTKARRAPTVPLPSTSTAIAIPTNQNPPQKNHQLDMDEILPYEEPIEEILNPKEDITRKSDDSELKRTVSVRRRSEEGIMGKSGDISGDILTKVTIPRSGSFLNAGGLTRYKSKINRSNGLTSGGSPLGFSELFAEFRLQENLHSLDDILAAIVRPEGMSFNDLKPIYKEFLLKLAVTLTKDELYQRAKCIMRRKKRREIKKKKVGVGVQKLKRVFRKSFHLNLSHKIKSKRLKSIKNSSSNTKSSSPHAAESSISTSSYDTQHFRPKDPTVQRRQSYKKKTTDLNHRTRRDRMSTSEDSDFFTMKRRKTKCSPSNQNRNSSSGYVSCSECSYDSDTCTCVSADKCYCSLGNRFSAHNNNKQKPTKIRPTTAMSCRSCQTCDDRCYCTLDPKLRTLTWCGCETDTCTESEKCYCQNGRGWTSGDVRKIGMREELKKLKKGLKKVDKFDPKNRIFEELQRKGFFQLQEDRVNVNPGLKTPKNSKKPKKKCQDKYCLCQDIPEDVSSQPSPNKSHLPSSRKLEKQNNNNNNFDYHHSTCQDCQNCNSNGTIFEELQRRGFIPSCEEMSTPPNHRKLTKKNSNTRSTKSVEYVHNPSEKYYEKMKNKYYDDLINELNSSKRNSIKRRSFSEDNLMETDLFRGNEVYGRAMSEMSPRNGFMQSSVRSFKSFNESHRKNANSKTLQTTLPPASSSEALSVKKSAEIAALFTDLKLSQTTDITHILPQNPAHFPTNTPSQSILQSRQFHKSNANSSKGDKKAIVTPYKHVSNNKMVQNSLYQRGIQTNAKNGLYNTRNGLYTIQSQSDSSCSENVNKGSKKVVGSLENTLGYLP